MRCSRCGSDVPGTSRFCSSCGLDLSATTPVRAIATGEITDVDLVREALAAEYEILAELGRGGMALVYRARDRQLEREVAVKVLPFSFAFDADFVERFQREARLSAQLEHPNIIPIYRVGQSGRVIYFVMKYLRGGSLSAILGERRRLAPGEIRRVLIEAGSALGYAAKRGIVHRDIKPDNIMFDEFGQSVLTDFGIAKAASAQKLTGTGMSIGTPHYMSPEQARAQNTDGRSDIYSLGVVAYQCLAGHVPYDGEDSFSIGYKHITEALPVPALSSADERRLFEVVRRMLAKDPSERYQSCEHLVAELQEDSVAAPGSLRLRGGPQPAPALVATPRTPAAAATVVTEARPVPPVPVAAAAAAPTVPVQPRRVAQRSVVMQQRRRPVWPWAAAVGVVAVAAAGYLYLTSTRTATANAAPTRGDSVAPAAELASSSLESAPSGPDSVGRPRASGAPGGADPAAALRAAGPASPPSRAGGPTSDSGAIRLVGIPAGSTVQIDERSPSGAVTMLAVGRHEVAILAPQHEFHVDTVVVTAGDTVELAPALRRLGAGLRSRPRTCEPGAAYNAADCFDERPRPGEAPFVAPPAGASPERGTTFWVQVSADGRTLGLRPLRLSRSVAFDRAAAAFVRRLSWEPARRDGSPLTAWTQIEVRPAP